MRTTFYSATLAFSILVMALVRRLLEPMTLDQFLLWLASGGGASIALSFVLERIPAFTVLSPSTKSYIYLAGSATLALAAYTVLTYIPPSVLEEVAPFFAIVAGVFVSWYAGQAAHAVDPARKP